MAVRDEIGDKDLGKEGEQLSDGSQNE